MRSETTQAQPFFGRETNQHTGKPPRLSSNSILRRSDREPTRGFEHEPQTLFETGTLRQNPTENLNLASALGLHGAPMRTTAVRTSQPDVPARNPGSTGSDKRQRPPDDSRSGSKNTNRKPRNPPNQRGDPDRPNRRRGVRSAAVNLRVSSTTDAHVGGAGPRPKLGTGRKIHGRGPRGPRTGSGFGFTLPGRTSGAGKAFEPTGRGRFFRSRPVKPCSPADTTILDPPGEKRDPSSKPESRPELLADGRVRSATHTATAGREGRQRPAASDGVGALGRISIINDDTSRNRREAARTHDRLSARCGRRPTLNLRNWQPTSTKTDDQEPARLRRRPVAAGPSRRFSFV